MLNEVISLSLISPDAERDPNLAVLRGKLTPENRESNEQLIVRTWKYVFLVKLGKNLWPCKRKLGKKLKPVESHSLAMSTQLVVSGLWLHL